MTIHPLYQVRRIQGAGALLAGVICLSLTGCGGLLPVTPVAAHQLRGTAFGGQQPIAGAAIQLYAANLTRMRGVSRAMLTSSVVTGNGGEFDITGLYACSPGDLVYIVAAGGDSGSGTNPAINLLAALGPCSGLSSISFINLTEVTTVASAYTLAPFMTDVNHVGSTAALLTGLQNAFAMEAVIADNSRGIAASHGAGLTIPVAELYSLADILAGCVNSSAGGVACSALMSAASASLRGTPVDTVGAALGIATAPKANVAALEALIPPTSPFQPTLPSAPPDWSLAVTLTSAGLKAPRGIAIDSLGNAWIANGSGSSVSAFSPDGHALAPAGYLGGGLKGAQAVAIDNASNVWLANTGADSIVELSNAGAVLSGASGYTAGGLATPVDIAIDPSGNVWIANLTGDSVTGLSAVGSALGGSPFTLGGSVTRPTAVAVSPTGDIWAASSGSGTLVAFSSSGAVKASGATDQWLQGTGLLAVDPQGTAWVAAPGIGAITAIDGTYAATGFSPDYITNASLPVALAIDGDGNIWVADGAVAGTISELSANSGLPIDVVTSIGALNSPLGIATDASGNVWTTNSGSDSVTVFVGLAVPAVTPLVNRLR